MPEQFFTLLLGSVILRPYVFLSVAIFLYFGKRELGWMRILTWLLVSYGIAFASEYSSVRTGFPYGWYYYVKLPTQHKELWVSDVPFFDSISYAFLSYWAFSAGRVLTGEVVFSGQKSWRQFPWKTWLTASILMMLADVVVDPNAVRGSRFFLGTIFGYPEWGPYFGVPLENFCGWLLVALLIMGTMLVLEPLLFKRLHLPKMKKEPIGALLYICIVLFNIGIAIYLREWNLLACDLLIMLPLFTWIVLRLQTVHRVFSAS